MAGGVAAHAAGDEIVHGALEVLRHLLHEAREVGAGLAEDLAAVGLYVARDQLHEGGFAGAVATDQADAFARIDLEVDVVENGGATEGVREIEETEKGHEPSSVQKGVACMQPRRPHAGRTPA